MDLKSEGVQVEEMARNTLPHNLSLLDMLTQVQILKVFCQAWYQSHGMKYQVNQTREGNELLQHT